MVEPTSRYRSYDPDIDGYGRYEEDRSYDRATHSRFGRSDRESSVPLFLSDEDGEPDPSEYMPPPRELRRSSISSRLLAGVSAAAAVAILFALFSSDATRDLVVNAKASIASFPAFLPGPSAAAQPDPARLTANDIQLKDPTRLSAPFNQTPGAKSVATVAVAPAAAAPVVAAPAPTRAEIMSAYQSAAQGRAPAAVAPVTAPPARKLAADELATLMNRAKGMLAAGDIPSARLLLERAADAQEPSAALLLAQTYDPAVLGTQDERSITADPAAARTWYEKAAHLGSADAQQRLAQIQN